MASDLQTQALKAFIYDDFELAVELFTRAISFRPKDAKLFAYRAQSNLRRRNFTEADADASRAIDLDPSMSTGYYCMGNVFYELEQYQNAKAAWELGSSLDPGNAKFTNLIKRCDERIAEIYGEILNPTLVKASTQVVPAEGGRESGQIVNEVPNQEPEEVVVTILAKGIPAKNVAVHFGEQSLSIIIHVPGEDAYHFQPSLFGKIAPDKCRYEELPSKIEVHLAKAEPLNWTSLDSAVPHKVTIVSGAGDQRPSYSTSKWRRL